MLISAHMSPDDEAVRMRVLRTSLRRVLDKKLLQFVNTSFLDMNSVATVATKELFCAI